jgi:hypothetical protein
MLVLGACRRVLPVLRAPGAGHFLSPRLTCGVRLATNEWREVMQSSDQLRLQLT